MNKSYLVLAFTAILFAACAPSSNSQNSELYLNEDKRTEWIEDKSSEPATDIDKIKADILEDWNAYRTMIPLSYNIIDKSIFSAYPLNSDEVVIVFHQKNSQVFELYRYIISSEEMLFLENIKEPPQTFQIIDEETFCIITETTIYSIQKDKTTTQNAIQKEKQFDCAINIKSSSLVFVDKDSNLIYERNSDGYRKLLWNSTKEVYEGTNDIKVKDESGKVVTNRAWKPIFSESGRYIAFTELEDTSKIYIYDTSADELLDYTVSLNLTNGSIYFGFIEETLLVLSDNSEGGNKLYRIHEQSMTEQKLDFLYSEVIRGINHLILADKNNAEFYLVDAEATSQLISITMESQYQPYVLTSTDTELCLRVKDKTQSAWFIAFIPY